MTQVPGFIGSKWKLPEVLSLAVGMSATFLLVCILLAKSLANWDLKGTETWPCLVMLSWGPIPWRPALGFLWPPWQACLSIEGSECPVVWVT